MAFSYKDYEESEKVKQYKTNLDTHNQNKVADWTGGTYGQGVNDALNRVLNRDKFTYDLNSDAIYNQYKNQYINLGKLAMQDTMGQAAALTGGYGNSYAATVGNQAYQGYLQQLNDVVPDLYQMALNQYNAEGDNLMNQYSMLANQYNTEYGEYRDKVSDWNTQRDYLTGLYSDERTYDYGIYSDNRDFSYTDYWNNLQMEYQKERDAVADEQWQKQYEASLRSSSGGGGVNNTVPKTPENVTTSYEEYMGILNNITSVYTDAESAAGYLSGLINSGIISTDTASSIMDSWERAHQAGGSSALSSKHYSRNKNQNL